MRLFLKLIFFLSLLIFPKLYAQIPAWQMPYDVSARWCTYININNGPGNPGPLLKYERYVGGYTVIGNQTYYSIYQSYSSITANAAPTYTCDQYCATMRSDSGRVYLQTFNDTAERLIFDFNLQVGQTFQRLVPYPMGFYTVHRIDTLMINGHPRRKFIDTLYNHYIIEGIGDKRYAFWGPEGFSCYQEGDSIYPVGESYNPFYCGIGFSGCSPLTTPDIANTNYTVFPNPASAYIQINKNYNVGNSNWLYIFDLSGRKVMELNMSDEPVDIIDISLLSSGMYILQFNDKSQKLLVE
jgi:hypothetical protein